jgi:hypothetical protein
MVYINQYVEVVILFFFKKEILIVCSSNFKEKFLVSVAMSGQFSGLCIALVEEVLTCAHTPQEYYKVC